MILPYHKVLASELTSPTIALMRHMQVFEDSLNRLQFHDVLSAEIDKKFHFLNKGYFNTVVETGLWFKLTLVNKDLFQRWFLRCYNHTTEQLEFYYPLAGGKFGKRDFGVETDLSPNDRVKGQFIALPFNNQSPTTFYIHFSSRLWNTADFELKNEDDLFLDKVRFHWVYGLIFGFQIFMILYHIFIYLVLKDQGYLYYLGYLMCYTLFLFVWMDLAPEYLPSSWAWWHKRCEYSLLSLNCFFGLLYANHFLQLKEGPQQEYKLILFFEATFLVWAGYTFVFPFGSMIPIVTQSLLVYSEVLLCVLCIRATVRGNPLAKYLLCAWLPLIGLVCFHLIYQWFTRKAFVVRVFYVGVPLTVIGGLIESLLLSFVLGIKVQKIRLALRDQRVRVIALERDKANALLKTIVSTQESERKRISRELHDDVGANLAILKMYLSELFKVKEEKADRLQMQMNSVDILNDSTSSLREIIYEMSPYTFEGKGLVFALTQLAERASKRGLTVTLEEVADLRTVPQGARNLIETSVYRISQELLANTLKHASATQVAMGLKKEGSKWLYSYCDNGIGFLIDEVHRGHGINNIETRVALLNGRFNVKSLPDQGVEVEILF